MIHDKFSFLIILYKTYLYVLNSLKRRGPSWSWSYGSWIYNYLQSVPITTKVVSLNPVHVEKYSLKHYVKQFVKDLRQCKSVVFSRYPGFIHQ